MVVSRLRRAGAVLVGKNNLHEIALGITSVNEHFGPVPTLLERDFNFPPIEDLLSEIRRIKSMQAAAQTDDKVAESAGG